jgi:hypothetical protein
VKKWGHRELNLNKKAHYVADRQTDSQSLNITLNVMFKNFLLVHTNCTTGFHCSI